MNIKIIISLLLVMFLTNTPTNNPVQFQLPGLEVPQNNTIDLPVRVLTQNNIVGSLEFALNYDQSILQFEEIILSDKSQQWLTYTMDAGNGKVRWGGYDKTHGTYSITEPTELFILKFKVLDFNWNTTPITIGRKTAGDRLGKDLPVIDTEGYINLNRNMQVIPEDGIFGKAYPVPTTGEVTVSVTVPQSGDYIVSIFDIHGSLKNSTSYKFIKGRQDIIKNLESYPSGTYLLHITNKVFTTSFKIIKH